MGRTKESPSEPGVPQSIGDALPTDEAATEAFVAPEVDQAAQVSGSRRDIAVQDCFALILVLLLNPSRAHLVKIPQIGVCMAGRLSHRASSMSYYRRQDA